MVKNLIICIIIISFTSLFTSCKESITKEANNNSQNVIINKKEQKDSLVTRKIIQKKRIDSKVEIDSVEYELSYVTPKEGLWIKDTIGGDKNLFFVKFNTELKLIKEGFEPIENTSISRRWWFIRTNNNQGWVSASDIGRKWHPDDDKLIDVSNSLIYQLKHKGSISELMKSEWDLIYHEDNRCDGSTDGQLNNLKKDEIDQTLTIKVINDGKGWLCDEKEEKIFYLKFSITQKTNDWDRFEARYDIGNKISYIWGKGESDYIVIYLEERNQKYLIKKLEYRSEDPG